MKKMKSIYVILFILVAICSTSCTGKNPLEPIINQAWGNYDYFPLARDMAWYYIESYPYDSSSYEIVRWVCGRSYREPYYGWAVCEMVDGVSMGYYYLYANTNEGIYNYYSYPEKWCLLYQVPFVIGNKWSFESTMQKSNGQLIHRTLKGEVMSREDMKTEYGEYKDCIKLLISVKDSFVGSPVNDSSYYFIDEVWFAPNIGRVKWVTVDTDIDYWLGNSLVLTKYFKEYYISSNNLPANNPVTFNRKPGYPILHSIIDHLAQ